MFMQRQSGTGIFGCNGFDVYSDHVIDVDGYKTKLIPSTAAGVSVDGWAANSQVFMKPGAQCRCETGWKSDVLERKWLGIDELRLGLAAGRTWMHILYSNFWFHYDFITKADVGHAS